MEPIKKVNMEDVYTVYKQVTSTKHKFLLRLSFKQVIEIIKTALSKIYIYCLPYLPAHSLI